MTDDWSSLPSEIQRQPDARRDRPPQTVVEYVASEAVSVSVALPKVPTDEAKWREEIARVTGLAVPDSRRVELAQVRYWGQPGLEQVYCRFTIADREDGATAGVDAVAILRELRKGRRKPPVPAGVGGDSAFLLSWGDWQTAKADGGGTPGLAGRLASAFDAAEARIAELRASGRTLGTLVIVGGGDMVEGCTIFPNQAYEIDGDRRAQIRNCVGFILAGIDQLAPLFGDVIVVVVGGNHGENRIGGKRTTRHDNDDCAVFEHAALACSRDPRLGHVRFVIAVDEPAKTLQVGPWILGATHGHVFQRGAGGPAAKARRWFEGQAGGRHPVGDADVLLSHHFHHYAAQDWGATLWVQAPAMDGGSPFFTDATGLNGAAGMLSWVMTPTKRFTDMQILN
jgi:hypothetical protein